MPAPVFIEFRKKQPKTAGFYVLRYKEGHEEQVYMDEPKHHYSDVYSYHATYFNYRDKDACCDMGMYVWCNSYNTHGPTEWRLMNPKEALAFSFALFRFGRSRAHKSGKKPLILEDVTPPDAK